MAGDQVEQRRLAGAVGADQRRGAGRASPSRSTPRMIAVAPNDLCRSRSTRTGGSAAWRRSCRASRQRAPGSTRRRVRPPARSGSSGARRPAIEHHRDGPGPGRPADRTDGRTAGTGTSAPPCGPPQHRVGIRHHDVDALDHEDDADQQQHARRRGTADRAGSGAGPRSARSRRACSGDEAADAVRHEQHHEHEDQPW